MIQTCLGQVSKNGTGHSAVFYEGTCNEKPWALMDFGFPPCLNKPTSLPLAASWERFPNSTSTQGLSEAIKVVVASQHPPTTSRAFAARKNPHSLLGKVKRTCPGFGLNPTKVP